MALTERYVTQAAAGGGDGSAGNPFTFAESVTHSTTNTGQRYNVQSDGAYSIGAQTFGTATFQAPNIWRGYDTTIGDCDNLGRNSDGTLNTTNMPAITITGQWVVPATSYNTFQSINFTGALSSSLIGTTTCDNLTLINCRVENTQNNASARCITIDDILTLINCDLVCSGASHDYLVTADNSVAAIGSRFELTASDDCISCGTNIVAIDSVFIKRGSIGGNGIRLTTLIAAANRNVIEHCTFYNLAAGIISTATHTGGNLFLYENHCTDCTKYIDNTTNIAVYDVHTRTRDNTSAPSTIELVEVGPITIDTGGHATDYVDAVTTRNMRLITTAPGYAVGWQGADLGGLQTIPSGGSAGSRMVNVRGGADQ